MPTYNSFLDKVNKTASAPTSPKNPVNAFKTVDDYRAAANPNYINASNTPGPIDTLASKSTTADTAKKAALQAVVTKPTAQAATADFAAPPEDKITLMPGPAPVTEQTTQATGMDVATPEGEDGKDSLTERYALAKQQARIDAGREAERRRERLAEAMGTSGVSGGIAMKQSRMLEGQMAGQLQDTLSGLEQDRLQQEFLADETQKGRDWQATMAKLNNSLWEDRTTFADAIADDNLVQAQIVDTFYNIGASGNPLTPEQQAIINSNPAARAAYDGGVAGMDRFEVEQGIKNFNRLQEAIIVAAAENLNDNLPFIAQALSFTDYDSLANWLGTGAKSEMSTTPSTIMDYLPEGSNLFNDDGTVNMAEIQNAPGSLTSAYENAFAPNVPVHTEGTLGTLEKIGMRDYINSAQTDADLQKLIENTRKYYLELVGG